MGDSTISEKKTLLYGGLEGICIRQTIGRMSFVEREAEIP